MATEPLAQPLSENLQHDPAELTAEFMAECQRVGVRVQDLVPALDAKALRVPDDSRGVGLDLVLALDCLRRLRDNAGTMAFVRSMNLSALLQAGGHRYPSQPRYSELHAIADTRREHDDAPAAPSMREIESAEEYLLAFVTSLAGDAPTRDRTLQRRGIYKEYPKIINAYLDHVGDGVEGIEALRRVTFLLWCSATQPACLTGMGELSESQEKEIIEWLDDACAEGELDPQLRWMLGYYHGAYPEVFGRFTQARSLQRVLTTTFRESWRAAEPEPRHFLNRGLMGHFWGQIVSAD